MLDHFAQPDEPPSTQGDSGQHRVRTMLQCTLPKGALAATMRAEELAMNRHGGGIAELRSIRNRSN